MMLTPPTPRWRSRVATLSLLVGTAISAPTDIGAQDAPSILSLLPTGGRQIQAGSEAAGTLSEADFRSPELVAFQAWALETVPGSPVTIDLISDDFDAYLYVLGAGSVAALLADDDSGGGCHSRITLAPAEGGAYTVIVSHIGVERTGAFLLRASPEPGPILDEPCGAFDQWQDPAVETLPEGIPTAGRIGALPWDGSGELSGGEGPTGEMGAPLAAWELPLAMGDGVTIDLISDAFDTVLFVDGPGIDGALMDDDGGEGLNSRLRFVAPADGTFRLVVSAFGESGGPYRLRVQRTEPEG